MRRDAAGWIAAGAGAVVLLLAGCATPTPPRAELAQARLAVDEAAEAEASRYAAAAYAEARDRLRAAEQAAADEDFVTARRLAEQAQAQAELAETRARAEQTSQQLAEFRESVEALERETERSTQRQLESPLPVSPVPARSPLEGVDR